MKYEQPEMEVIRLKRNNVVTDSPTQTKPKEDDYEFGDY